MAYYSSGYQSAASAAGAHSHEDVKKLQTKLNAGGAGIAVDGIYGPETDAAYRAYSKSSGADTPRSYIAGVSEETAKQVRKYGEGYTPSQAAADAQKDYETLLGERPEAFQSQYDAALQELYDSIAGRDEFVYDLNGDALYRQYRDAYMRQGKAAMEDTMGEAAALTGGYGSTYAETVGAQAYDSYLQELGSIVPELYRLALDRYEAEGDGLQRQYAMLSGLRDDEYETYMDAYDAWQDAVKQSYSTWQDIAERDWDTWAEGLDYWTERAETENKDYWTAYKNAGSGGGSSKGGGKGNENAFEETDTGFFGRYARAIDREFSRNAYGRFDMFDVRKQYLNYYRDEGLITTKEYAALLNGNYGA